MNRGDEGEWCEGFVQGHGWIQVWRAYDEAEQKANGGGLLTASKAAELLGHSRHWIATRVKLGQLQVQRWAGRDYIKRSSVERLLSELGTPTEEEARLEQLEERGEGHMREAGQIRSAMQARATARDQALFGIPDRPLMRDAEKVIKEPVASNQGFIGWLTSKGDR